MQTMVHTYLHRGLHRADIPMAGCSPWLTGSHGWKKSRESGYSDDHGYKILFELYFFMRSVKGNNPPLKGLTQL